MNVRTIGLARPSSQYFRFQQQPRTAQVDTRKPLVRRPHVQEQRPALARGHLVEAGRREDEEDDSRLSTTPDHLEQQVQVRPRAATVRRTRPLGPYAKRVAGPDPGVHSNLHMAPWPAPRSTSIADDRMKARAPSSVSGLARSPTGRAPTPVPSVDERGRAAGSVEQPPAEPGVVDGCWRTP